MSMLISKVGPCTEGRGKEGDNCIPGKGKYNPSLKLAYDISKLFEMTIEEVFLFDEP